MISIIVIVVTGLVPSFTRGSEARALKGAATRIGDMMAFCHSMAVSEGQPFRLTAFEGESRVWVAHEGDPESPGVYVPYGMSGYALFELPRGVFVKSFSLDQEPDEDETDSYIEFRRDGSADGGALIIGVETGESYSILVASLTGRVRIVDYDVEEGQDGYGA